MFASTANPYDEIIIKATDENLASEDWALNIEVCDKVSGEGQTGARNAIGALQKRLSHRNPNVQLYALELANTLAQNCGKPLLEELSSRGWTAALDRLVNDRTTAAPVKTKALGYIKSWAKQFEDIGDPNLGIMGELYDQLRAKNFVFDEPEPVPENTADARRRQEEEELQRVLELSKQDKGGRAGYQSYQSQGPSASSSSQQQSYVPPAQSQAAHQPAYAPPAPIAETEQPLDINTATRVRALYTFTSAEIGELNFERGDIIKVLDRGFKEWWRGACNGNVGIFPVTYVEPLPEQTARELQEEAQQEARIFASLGLVDQLLQTLKSIDPSRGDRLDDRPEIEQMYQESVALQGEINALIKKYSDQKAELDHMNANFLRAMRQYEELRQPPQQAYGYAPQPDPYAAAHQPYPPQPQQSLPNGYPAQAQAQSQYAPPHAHSPSVQQLPHEAFPLPRPAQPGQQVQVQPENQPGGFYTHDQHQSSRVSLQRAPSGAPGFPPQSPPRQATQPGAAGIGAGADAEAEHKAAWDAYYAAQAQAAQQSQSQGQAPQYAAQIQGQGGVPVPAQVQLQGHGQDASGVQQHPQQQPYGASPYPAQPYQPPQQYGAPPVDAVVNGLGRMSVQGQ